MQGAKQGGAGGLLNGIGNVLTGSVTKPVGGAMDLVTEPATFISSESIFDGSGAMVGYALGRI